jgi:hypothetical protein
VEWLELVRGRLRHVEEERESVGSEIARLESLARQLSEERLHLRALLDLPTDSDAQSSAVVASPPPAAETLPPSADMQPNQIVEPKVNSSEVWRTGVRDILLKAGRPMHYTLVQSALRRTGVTFGGQNPAASFLAVLNRDPSFERVGRGIYWVKGEQYAEKAAAIRRKRRARSKVRKVS